MSYETNYRVFADSSPLSSDVKRGDTSSHENREIFMSYIPALSSFRDNEYSTFIGDIFTIENDLNKLLLHLRT